MGGVRGEAGAVEGTEVGELLASWHSQDQEGDGAGGAGRRG